MSDEARGASPPTRFKGPGGSAKKKNRQLMQVLEAGLTPAQIRRAVGVSEPTVRNWIDGTTAPRESAAQGLDDLSTAIVALRATGKDDEEAVEWLTTRNLSRWLGGDRPIDVLREDPLRVLAAIEELLLPDEDDDNVVHLHIREHLTV